MKTDLSDTRRLQDATAWRVLHLARRLRHSLAVSLEAWGTDLSPEQYFILFQLAEEGQPLCKRGRVVAEAAVGSRVARGTGGFRQDQERVVVVDQMPRVDATAAIGVKEGGSIPPQREILDPGRIAVALGEYEHTILVGWHGVGFRGH